MKAFSETKNFVIIKHLSETKNFTFPVQTSCPEDAVSPLFSDAPVKRECISVSLRLIHVPVCSEAILCPRHAQADALQTNA